MNFTHPQRVFLFWQTAVGLTGLVPALFGIFRSAFNLIEYSRGILPSAGGENVAVAVSPFVQAYLALWIVAGFGAIVLFPGYIMLLMQKPPERRTFLAVHWGTLGVNFLLAVLYFSSVWVDPAKGPLYLLGLYPFAIFVLWLWFFHPTSRSHLPLHES